MSFTQDAWENNLDLYQATLNHPFNQELAAGTLNKDAFRHYIIQDAHYLLAYGRALAVCAAKAYSAEEVIQFAEAAKTAVVVERSLHDEFMSFFSISKEEFENTPLTLACHHYTSFLLSTAWSESYPVVLASLIPCFWIYAEIGKDILENSSYQNPYQAWIDTYAGEDFHNTVHQVIQTMDAIAEQCDTTTIKKMHDAYTMGAKLEWHFWNSAYYQHQWLGID